MVWNEVKRPGGLLVDCGWWLGQVLVLIQQAYVLLRSFFWARYFNWSKATGGDSVPSRGIRGRALRNYVMSHTEHYVGN